MSVDPCFPSIQNGEDSHCSAIITHTSIVATEVSHIGTTEVSHIVATEVSHIVTMCDTSYV